MDFFYPFPVTPLLRIIKLLLNALPKFKNSLRKDVISFIRNIIILNTIILRKRSTNIKSAITLLLLLFINLFTRIINLFLLRIKLKNLKKRIN